MCPLLKLLALITHQRTVEVGYKEINIDHHEDDIRDSRDKDERYSYIISIYIDSYFKSS